MDKVNVEKMKDMENQLKNNAQMMKEYETNF